MDFIEGVTVPAPGATLLLLIGAGCFGCTRRRSA